MKKILSLVCFLFIFGTKSEAGLMIDPYIGYAINQGEADYAPSGINLGKADMTTTGSILGARVGWQTLGLMLGGEFGYAPTLSRELTASKLTGGSDSEADFSGTYMGAFIGYDFPILLRVWATQFFNITYAPESGSDLEASGTSFGVGFSGLPFVSLNAEYRMISYDATGIDDSAEIFLSVSLPITL